jgi:hypothetical protein
MARFSGRVGFAIATEKMTVDDQGDSVGTGIFIDSITERNLKGDVITERMKYTGVPNRLNDDLRPLHRISLVSDPFLMENLATIKYVVLLGVRYSVTDIEVRRPRVILSLGGVYNGPATNTS